MKRSRGRPFAGSEPLYFHNIERARAHKEGREAWDKGISRYDCPYDNGRYLALRCEWMAGFFDAQGVHYA